MAAEKANNGGEQSCSLYVCEEAYVKNGQECGAKAEN